MKPLRTRNLKEFCDNISVIMNTPFYVPLIKNPKTDKCKFGGTGGFGKFLEDVLQVEGGNLKGSDRQDFELKTWYTDKNSHSLTVNQRDPEGVEGSGKSETIRRLLRRFGKVEGRSSRFNHTIKGRSDLMEVVINGNRIELRLLEDGSLVCWWFKNRILTDFTKKMSSVALVHCLPGMKINIDGQSGQIIVYDSAQYYEEVNLTDIDEFFKRGIIFIDFGVNSSGDGKALRNHGTRFRVQGKHLSDVFGTPKKLFPDNHSIRKPFFIETIDGLGGEEVASALNQLNQDVISKIISERNKLFSVSIEHLHLPLSSENTVNPHNECLCEEFKDLIIT